eukprot:gene9124-7865_t
MSSRLATLKGHLAAASTTGHKSPDDVVVVWAKRTAIGRARKGSFRDTTPDTLLSKVLEAAIAESGVPMDALGDICVGNVQLGGAYAGPARMAQFVAGIPETVPLSSVNRQCSSGLQAVATIANAIKAGQIVGGIGAGVESMTHGGGVADPNSAPPPIDINEIIQNKLAKDSLTPMGVTSENVASRYGITRSQQDALAVSSHAKAIAATESGHFAKEIVPITVTVEVDDEDQEITVTKDDGPRPGTTMEKLAGLRAVFKEGGSTTAGNASQVSDGAAAVVLLKRSKANELGLPIIGAYRGYQVVGVMPDEMGVGPAVAIPAVLKECGLSIDDIDVYEINEAFASQAAYCVQKLGIPMEKVNPNGGAIALGHPLGCTGARQVATLFNELHAKNKKLGVISMCIGTGMGAAAVFEAE